MTFWYPISVELKIQPCLRLLKLCLNPKFFLCPLDKHQSLLLFLCCSSPVGLLGSAELCLKRYIHAVILVPLQNEYFFKSCERMFAASSVATEKTYLTNFASFPLSVNGTTKLLGSHFSLTDNHSGH